jgi:SAM-dependent methyltransferase
VLPNASSRTWRDLFLHGISADDTQRQVELVLRHLPQPGYHRLLDVACGSGRHARALAQTGYDVVAIDRSPELIAEAASAATRAQCHVLDMCELARLDAGPFDGVLNLWHSFGFQDAATNQTILEQFAGQLRPGGRALLDVYNRDHAIRRPAVEQTRRADMHIETRRFWLGPRLTLELRHDGVLGDRFDWHIYSPDELEAACRAAGFDILLTCARFDDALPASAEHARMQLLLGRRRAERRPLIRAALQAAADARARPRRSERPPPGTTNPTVPPGRCDPRTTRPEGWRRAVEGAPPCVSLR